METTTQKTCSVCKKSYPGNGDYFTKNRSTPDGLERVCKTCKSDRQKTYRNKVKKEASEGKTRRAAKRQGGPSKSRAVNVTKAKSTTRLAIAHTISLPMDAIVAIERAVAKKVCEVIAKHFGI